MKGRAAIDYALDLPEAVGADDVEHLASVGLSVRLESIAADRAIRRGEPVIGGQWADLPDLLRHPAEPGRERAHDRPM
jgi:hypothetical protein